MAVKTTSRQRIIGWRERASSPPSSRPCSRSPWRPPDPAYRVVANPRVPGASEAQLPETVKALRIE
jgi:hypothetical protein